jgi:hypothetical protein
MVVENVSSFFADSQKSADCGSICEQWYFPYFHYLQALAYEQSGQLGAAKQTYFELWRDYPENIFGVAASQRLLPIQP